MNPKFWKPPIKSKSFWRKLDSWAKKIELLFATKLDDFIKNIVYSEEGNQEYFEKVEKSLQQICCLLSCLIINNDIREKFDNIDNYLEEQMGIYEDKKCISKKIRLVCKNIISEYRSKN